jgi:serine protease Do
MYSFLANRVLGAGLACLLVVLATTPGAYARSAPDSFADLAEKTLPAVVNISTTQTIKGGAGPGRPQFPPGSPFEEFFKDFFDKQQQQPNNKSPRKATSLGSGFVIDASGLIVTNNHVIADADEIFVRFQDDVTLPAKLIGRDEKTDIAVLKVETDKPLPFLPIGDSAKARVGDWVVAIGNPFGLGGSVTAGIISARQRDIRSGPYDAFIQTDAAINKGNSGGPLINLAGEVIGINTAIYSPSGGSVGIGFAVPTSLAKSVIGQLRKFGETRRGWLGVHIQTVTDEIADSLGLGSARGALVANVTEGGPAEKGGVLAGDVILRFDDKEVDKMRKLPRLVAETEVGKSAAVVVWRKGKEVRLSVDLGRLEAQEAKAVATSDVPDSNSKAALVDEIGADLATLDDKLRAQFSISEDVDGVVITELKPDGNAAQKGLEPGDVILEINQDSVASPGDVASMIAKAVEAGRTSVLLLVNRSGDRRFIVVPVTAG